MKGLVAALIAGLFLAACASSHVLVGTARAPIDPEQVKVYLEPPASYESVALLEASDMGANGFSQQSRTNKVMKRLKAEAAELGANGVLMQGIDTQFSGAVGSYAGGVGYAAAQSNKVGKAVAIYVEPSE